MNHINMSMLENVLPPCYSINIIGANLYNIKVAKNVEDSRTKSIIDLQKLFNLPITAKNVHRNTISLPHFYRGKTRKP